MNERVERVCSSIEFDTVSLCLRRESFVRSRSETENRSTTNRHTKNNLGQHVTVLVRKESRFALILVSCDAPLKLDELRSTSIVDEQTIERRFHRITQSFVYDRSFLSFVNVSIEFLKRRVSQNNIGQHPTSNLNTTINTGGDSSSDTSSSTTERVNQRRNDGYSSTSTLGIVTGNGDESVRRPLLHLRSTNRRRTFLTRLSQQPSAMIDQHEQSTDDHSCLLDKKLPKELILR
jgi:hypothetical protein